MMKRDTMDGSVGKLRIRKQGKENVQGQVYDGCGVDSLRFTDIDVCCYCCYGVIVKLTLSIQWMGAEER